MNQLQPGAPKPAVSKWLWIVLIIVVLAAGGYFGWYFLKGPGKKTTTSTPTTTTTTTTTDKTAGWQTYKNDTYGFSFKYPKEWTKKDGQSTNALVTLNLNEAGYQPKEDTDMPNTMDIQLFESLKKLDTKSLNPSSLKDYLDKYSVVSDANIDPTYKNVKSEQIGDKSGYSAKAGSNVFGGGIFHFVELDGKQILQIHARLDKDGNEYQTEKTILSTFKFTK